MIELDLLQPISLHSLPLGGLFRPAVDGGERFLSGRINETPVLVSLEGEIPFCLGPTESWSRAPGYWVRDTRIRVDPVSARLPHDEQEAGVGSIVLMENFPALISTDRHARFAVQLTPDGAKRRVKRGDVAFANWDLVTGRGDDLFVHFTNQMAVTQ